MKTIIFYILGILFVTLGLFFIIININLFFIGYSFIQFVNFIISSPQCNIFFIGYFPFTLSPFYIIYQAILFIIIIFYFTNLGI